MLSPVTPDALLRRRVTVTGVVIGVLVLAWIAYAVLIHRSATPDSDSGVRFDRSTAATSQAPEPVTVPSALEPTDDPATFARRVALALFAWDTATLVGRSDHIEQLVAVADPTGQSTPGLVGDLGNYLPTPDAWGELAQYETRQWLSIDSVTTPQLWADAVVQAGPDGLLPGTTAFTIRGVRHRWGVWEGEPVATSHEVAFTVFIVCAPSYPNCHLLRLSLLDKPLD
jgi:hypothetical protein